MPDLGHKPSLARATIQCHLPQKGPSLSSIWHPLSVHACDELSQSWMSATDLQTLCLGHSALSLPPVVRRVRRTTAPLSS